MRTKGIILLCGCFLLTSVPGFGQSPGDLDPSFGMGGIVRTSIQGVSDKLNAVELIDGELILVAGYTLNPFSGLYNMVVARYFGDGTLDPGFGPTGTGYLIIPVGIGNSYVTAMTIDPVTGNIILAGMADNPSLGHDFALVRLFPGGDPDPSFGIGGIVLTDFFEGDDIATAVGIGQGQIIAAGLAYDQNHTGAKVAFASYEIADGSLNAAFDGNPGTMGVARC